MLWSVFFSNSARQKATKHAWILFNSLTIRWMTQFVRERKKIEFWLTYALSRRPFTGKNSETINEETNGYNTTVQDVTIKKSYHKILLNEGCLIKLWIHFEKSENLIEKLRRNINTYPFGYNTDETLVLIFHILLLRVWILDEKLLRVLTCYITFRCLDIRWNTPPAWCLINHPSMFGFRMKHTFSCLIYYLLVYRC